LILRKKYYDEVPLEDSNMSNMSSASMMSLPSEMSFTESPVRQTQQPPPYRFPPQADNVSPLHVPPAQSKDSMNTIGLPQSIEQYKECVNEFQQVMSNFKDSNRVDVASRKNSFEQIIEEQTPALPPRRKSEHRSISRENSTDENKENNVLPESEDNKVSVSVKEAMLKFNRFASEEEAKIPSPISKSTNKAINKNKADKVSFD
jgi:hypothetical protein